MNRLLIALLLVSTSAGAERLKDLATIQGVRQNQLIGYGLVVGLEGTGDQSVPFTNQSLINAMQQMGVNLPQGTNLKSKNTAAVVVTGSLAAFSQPGQTMDVTISSVGTAKSLRGGTLMMTPLKGADGQIYALAQGNVTVGGVSGPGAPLKPGIITDGAIIERAVTSTVGQGDYVKLELKESDFSMAGRVVEAINTYYGKGTAEAENGLVIKVRAPAKQNERVAFIGGLEVLEIKPAKLIPKVVFNLRTGTVVMNQAVTLDECAVSHGSLSLVVSAAPTPAQTQAIPDRQLMVLKPGVLLADVVKTLNSVGATPEDMLIMLQSMKAAGALHAELEIN